MVTHFEASYLNVSLINMRHYFSSSALTEEYNAVILISKAFSSKESAPLPITH